MLMQEFKMAKKIKWHTTPSLCPQCKNSLPRKIEDLRWHFRSAHGRLPTEGEEIQFIAYREIDPRTYNEGVSIWSFSGGLPSLGRRSK
jgi:hypothetical protein